MARFCLLVSFGALTGLLSGGSVSAVAKSSESTKPNAAVIYWQAFAAMPPLDGIAQKNFDAAAKSAYEPVDNQLLLIVTMFEKSLAVLHRAHDIPACDWQLDFEQGPELTLPHLEKARKLGRAALLRAKLRYASGENDSANADIVAVLKLARDCGSSPSLISILVDGAMEKTAINVLAANLWRLSGEQLEQLTRSIKQLPETASLVEGVEQEERAFGGWLERLIDAEAAKLQDPAAGSVLLAAVNKRLGAADTGKPDPTQSEALRRYEMIQTLTVADGYAMLRRMRVDYKRIVEIASLDYSKQPALWEEFEADLSKAKKLSVREDLNRMLSVSFLPSVSRFSDRVARIQIQRHLIQLAIQVQHHGPAILKSAEASAHGKIGYRKTETGFELQAAMASSDQPEVLRVGLSE